MPRVVVASPRSGASLLIPARNQSPTLPRATRLRSADQFKRVLQAHTRVSGRWFTICVVANQVGRARLGIVVGRRALSKAVHRSRIKRVAREGFRRNAVRLGAQDVVVRLRSNVAVEDLAAAEAELQALFRDLTP